MRGESVRKGRKGGDDGDDEGGGGGRAGLRAIDWLVLSPARL